MTKETKFSRYDLFTRSSNIQSWTYMNLDSFFNNKNVCFDLLKINFRFENQNRQKMLISSFIFIKSDNLKLFKKKQTYLFLWIGLELGIWNWGCQLVLRTAKFAGARGDVQNFGGCQAPASPVLTRALNWNKIRILSFSIGCLIRWTSNSIIELWTNMKKFI